MNEKVKNILRKLMTYLGFTLQIKRLGNWNGKPLYVEFTGVAGVGKSTIYKRLISINNNLIKATNFTRKFALNKQEKNAISEDLFYNNILNDQIYTMSQGEYPALDKIRMLNSFKNVLIKDKIIFANNKNFVIVDDEGFFKYFSNHIFRRYSLNENRDELLEKIINRVIVYCYSTPENIVAQILKRYQETGNIIVPFRNKSKEQLINIIRERLEKENSFIQLMKEIKIPLLLINTSDDITDNAKKINAFITDLQKIKE